MLDNISKTPAISRTRFLSCAALAVAMASSSVPVLAQAPVNDDFLNRLPLGGLSVSVWATNTFATAEPGEMDHRGQAPVRTLWWRWTAPVDAYVVIDTGSNSPSRTLVDVYDYHKVLSLLNTIPLLSACGLPTPLDHYEFSAAAGLDYNIVVDGLGGDSGAFELNLQCYTAPDIQMQPSDTNVTAGTRASIAVCAIGDQPLAYQWQFSSISPNAFFTNLASGTSPQLAIGTFGVIAKADEGWYRVIITNSYGSVMSEPAKVNVSECVIPNPLQPATLTTNVGATVSYTATGLGTQPFSYQWQFKGPNDADFGDLDGETSASLVMTNISTDQAGQYRFLVSNVACSNQLSSVASLAVTTANALVLDPNYPHDADLLAGSDTNFQVHVTQAFQPVSYQWWSGPDANVSHGAPQAGEIGPEFDLYSVQTNQMGYYWATVSNRYTNLTSRVARLIVETRPPNDNFADSIPFFPVGMVLSTNAVSTTNVAHWSNKNATAEPGEPAHDGVGPKYSVWWSFTPPVDGTVIVALTAPNSPPQVIAAYTGFAVDQLTPVTNRTNRNDLVEFVGTNNVEYSFAVDGQDYSANINLTLTFNPHIGAPTVTLDPADVVVVGGFPGSGTGLGGCHPAQFSAAAISLDGVVNCQWEFSTNVSGPFTDLAGQTGATLQLTNVTTADAGWYQAAFSNGQGAISDSAAAQLTVVVAPSITAQPASVTSNACTQASFAVQVDSCSPVSYLWLHNGLPVQEPNAAGTTNATLHISDLAPTNAGSYQVVVSNANQAVTSAPATLTVETEPTISRQPQSVSTQPCENATFQVTATAACTLLYQWRFEGQAINGATNSTLTLTNLQPADAGSYDVIVSSAYTSVFSSLAELTLLTNPVITTDVKSSSPVFPACDMVNLAIQVEPEPSCSFLAYQWQFTPPGPTQWTNLAGATNSSFSFEAQAETAGSYRVIVSNRWTSVASAVANVAVNAAPWITAQPASSQQVRQGDPFTNQVTVWTCGSLAYSWLFKPPGGTAFSPVTLDKNHQLSTNGWLIVQNAQTNDSGYYYVVVSNLQTNANSATSLVRVIAVPPNDNFAQAINLGSNSVASAQGYNVYATAEPGEPAHGGQPAVHSVWWVWTCPVPSLVTADTIGSDISTTLGIYTGDSVSSLTTVAKDANGAGNGRSKVSFMAVGGGVLHFAVDGLNGAEGTNLILTIRSVPIVSPPVISQQPLSLAATPGDTVVFTNQAWGSPDVSVQWFSLTGPVPGATQILDLTNYFSTLTLTNVQPLSAAQPDDGGVYFAVLSNGFGSVTSALATLTFGSIVRGLVTDATETTSNGIAVGIPGVTVSVGNVSTMTDSNGGYELVGVDLGDFRAQFMANATYVHLNEPVEFWNQSTADAAELLATKTGYYNYVDDNLDVGQGQTIAKRFSMSPILVGMRFVLNWTNEPADLDLLLNMPPTVGISYLWIDYLNQNKGSLTAPPYAEREAAAVTGWGPDTITIGRFFPGTYGVYARKYPGEADVFLTQSHAQLVAYLGSNTNGGTSVQLMPIGAVDVPTQGTNDWWHICDIDGTTTNITWINELLPGAPSGLESESGGGPTPGVVDKLGLGALPGQESESKALRLSLDHARGPVPPRPMDGLPSNASYDWDFGDGSPISHDVEPTHAYADPGWKTVTLTVTQTNGQSPKTASLTKTNYIQVINLPPTISITNPLPDTIFRAGDPITLQSTASGVDDGMDHVDYYMVSGGTTNSLGRATSAPWTWVYPNTNYVDVTNQFVALAYDQHGASTWSDVLPVITRDLRGDILIVRNFPAPEIDNVAAFIANNLIITAQDTNGNRSQWSAVVKILDQEGLYFGLVQGFKLILWDDLGQTNPGLSDNDVAVFNQAYQAGIPLYLIGGGLAGSLDNLTNEQTYVEWANLIECQQVGSVSNLVNIQGIQTSPEDGLFYGWYPLADASTNIPYQGPIEVLQLTGSDLEVVADFSVPGEATNSPVMLRYPPSTQGDFGQTRRLVQDFCVASAPPDPGNNRLILCLNGAAWLLRLFECQELNAALNCLQPPPINVGDTVTFSITVSQNGECTAGGVVVSNVLSPQLLGVSAQVLSVLTGAPADTNVVQVTLTNNVAVARFAQLPGRADYEFDTMAIALRRGWITNSFTLTRGLYSGVPCSQVAFINGPACAPQTSMKVLLDTNNLVHVRISGGAGCTFQLQSSPDLQTWTDTLPVVPDTDPYDQPMGPPSDLRLFYRLRETD